jgi:hypothetical protein
MALAVRPREGAQPWLPGRFTRVALAVGCLALLAVPAAMAWSQRQLNISRDRLDAGDCPGAIDAALASTDALSVRPEPFEIIALCDLRLGRPDLSVRMIEAAIDRDPESWALYQELAVFRAFAGQDPRPAARRAKELNPREELTRDVVRRFDTADPRKWKRRAESARLPIN